MILVNNNMLSNKVITSKSELDSVINQTQEFYADLLKERRKEK